MTDDRFAVLRWLIRFRFRATVLVGHLVFFEQVGHFFSHYRIIILNGEHRNFFSRLGLLFRRGGLRLFWMISHRT